MHTRSYRHAVLSMLLIGLFLVGSARGATLYVCGQTGDDTAPGTGRAAPLRTVAAAMEQAEPGTVITLLSGWHAGGIELKPGEPDRPITLRGERRGRVFVGRPADIIGGWTRVPGMQYTYAAARAEPVRMLLEVSSGVQLLSMPSAHDVEHLAGTFHHDADAGRLFVHHTDSESALRHLTMIPPAQGTGVTLAHHTIVEDLVITGMGHAAVTGSNVEDAVVRRCIIHGNGYGVYLRGGTDVTVRDNDLWGNVPGYAAGSQIYVTRPAGEGPPPTRIVIERNRVLASAKSDIRFYSTGDVRDCVIRSNLLRRSHTKGLGEPGLKGAGNISLGSFWAPESSHNTYRHNPRPATRADSDLLIDERDWRFADPAWLDYRLQSDSPARGAAPGGRDLGALPYDGSVVYVSPDGDDDAPGTAESKAWRTLAHATASLRPGQTLYLAPGDWSEPLNLTNLVADAKTPTRIRAADRARVTLPALRIADSAHLIVEGLTILGESAGVSLSGSRDIALRHCALARPPADGANGPVLDIRDSRTITLEHLAIAGPGPAVSLADAIDVELVSSLLASTTGPQLRLRGATGDFWSEYNAFADDADQPLVETPDGAMVDLDAWRARSGLDRQSTIAARTDFVSPETADFRIAPGAPVAFGARHARAVGPHGVQLPSASRPPIERVDVLSTTRTSANITWWTPGRVTGTMIEWGTSPDYGNRYDRGNRGRGEYETFHDVSLIGLDPETTYHFRVGFRDHITGDDEADDESAIIAAAGDAPIIWSDDFTFTTAAEDPEPRRLFVAPDGDDARDGLTHETAWRNLAHAAREARAGDTVTLAPGRYTELLRPLQTGTSEDRRITFRAEDPLTVFLDGGWVRDGTGRSHNVQLMSKAYITLENLAMQAAHNFDNGGYRGWPGYAGQIRLSGSTGIVIRACVMDGRHRFMCGLVAEAVGTMPGAPVPEETPPLRVTDSLFLGNWYAVYLSGRGPNDFRHNAFVRGRVLMAAFDAPTVFRNNIVQSLGMNKSGSNLFIFPDNMDADYNCYGWDEENTHRIITWSNWRTREYQSGLAGWQEVFGKGVNSIEADPGYPLSAQVGFGGNGMVGPYRPLSISDLILPPVSPCRGAGEGGADIGPRWERFLDAAQGGSE